MLLVSAECKLGIRLGWLIYLVICPNEVISGGWVSICPVWCNNCNMLYRYPPYFTCVIWHIKPFLRNSSTNSKTGFIPWVKWCYWGMNSALFGSLMGGGYLSLAILRLSTAIKWISHMKSRQILCFSSLYTYILAILI